MSLDRHDELLADLNVEQRMAVEVSDRPVLVLAGAGSGKTRVITRKIAWLVGALGYAPDQILALTFTNKAAGEMRSRTLELLGPAAERATVGTFHSVGLRILRRYAREIGRSAGFVIYDGHDQETLTKRILRAQGIDERVIRPSDVVRAIQDAKQRCVGPAAFAARAMSGTASVVARVYGPYEKALCDCNALDFGDLIWHVIQLFEAHPDILALHRRRFRHVLVDEFQDTDVGQGRLVRLLVGDDGEVGVTAVGDDDQSIYGWRGAHIDNILQFPRWYEHVAVVRLERNYRSTKRILAAASALIAHNEARHEKTLWTEGDEGAPIELCTADTELEEAAWVVDRIRALRSDVPLARMAVFYRTNAQSRPLEDALRQVGLPYTVIGGIRFYERSEVKDVLAYLRLLVNPADDVSFTRILNRPRRGLGDQTLAALVADAEAAGTSLWTALPACATRLGGAAERRLLELRALLEGLRAYATTATAEATAVRTIHETRFLEQYADGSVESESRAENVRELVAAVEAFTLRNPSALLADFLDQAALVADVDRLDEGTDAVPLMTIHASKGLEFDAVFVVGLEEGIFPHAGAGGRGSGRDVEEERRLAYVALTRARRRLFLSHAVTRRRFGAIERFDPSRFLRELPPALLVARRQRSSFGYGSGNASGGPVGGSLAGGPVPRAVSAPVRRRPESPSAPADPDAVRVDRSYDQTLDADSTESLVGRRVQHATFGIGRIVSVSYEILKVDFPSVGRKAVSARFLQVLD